MNDSSRYPLRPLGLRYVSTLVIASILCSYCGKNVDSPLSALKDPNAIANQGGQGGLPGGASPFTGIGSDPQPGDPIAGINNIPPEVTQMIDPSIDLPKDLLDLYNNPGDLNSAQAPLKALLSVLPLLMSNLDPLGSAMMSQALQQLAHDVALIKKDTPKEKLKAIFKKVVQTIISLLKQLKGHVKKK